MAIDGDTLKAAAELDAESETRMRASIGKVHDRVDVVAGKLDAQNEASRAWRAGQEKRWDDLFDHKLKPIQELMSHQARFMEQFGPVLKRVVKREARWAKCRQHTRRQLARALLRAPTLLKFFATLAAGGFGGAAILAALDALRG